MFNAGRVGFTPKGDYDSTKTYSMLNVVSHQGSSYFAKGDVPVNTAPPNTTYWQLSAYGGSAANLAGNFAPLETTDYASQGYEIGDFLVNKNNQFCKATSIITLGDQIIVKPNAGYNVETTNAGKEVNRIDLRIDQLTASQIGYDGTGSGLSATDVKAAIDEVVSDLGTLDSQVSAHDTALAKTYKTDDTTENTLASDDVLPFYDTSATAQRKMSVEKFVGQIVSNPNLLDNPWFTVNQRGVTTLSEANNAFTVDRWNTFCVDLIVNDNGISFKYNSTYQYGYVVQGIEEAVLKSIVGKPVTASIMLQDGTIKSGTVLFDDYTTNKVFKAQGSDGIELSYVYQNNKGIFRYVMYSSSAIAVRALKLELGSASTLAMDTAPNYTEELLKCQRYFYSLNPLGEAYKHIGMALCASDNLYIDVIVPVSMRAKPSISMSGAVNARAADGTGVTISTYTAAVNLKDPNCIRIELSNLSAAPQAGFNYVDSGATPKLELSADI